MHLFDPSYVRDVPRFYRMWNVYQIILGTIVSLLNAWAPGERKNLSSCLCHILRATAKKAQRLIKKCWLVFMVNMFTHTFSLFLYLHWNTTCLSLQTPQRGQRVLSLSFCLLTAGAHHPDTLIYMSQRQTNSTASWWCRRTARERDSFGGGRDKRLGTNRGLEEAFS